MRVPSPALIVACIALMLATGGAAHGTVDAVTGGPQPPSNPFQFSALSCTDADFTA